MNVLTRSSIAILTIGLAAMIAEATPALGDKAVYDVTLTKGTQTVQGLLTFELTSYDKATDMWTQTATTDFNNQKQTQTETLGSKDLMDDFSIDYVLKNCAARNGVSETVTSPAGDFPACAVPVSNSQGSGKVWVAKVPFGYAKWINNRKDGVIVESIIKSFQLGTAQ
jgi:hypothetical protein